MSIITRKRFIPIGSFGGAGARISKKISQWRMFGLHVPNTIPGTDDLAQLAGPWSDGKLETVARLLDIRSFLKLLIKYGRSNDWRSLKDYIHDTLQMPEPVVMSEVFGAGRSLPEKFEQLATPVHAGIAVITPDDICGLSASERGQSPMEFTAGSPRARQNVWLEIGWFWGAVGRKRILLLVKEGGIEIPSDLHGIEYAGYRNNPGAECADKIRGFIASLADRREKCSGNWRLPVRFTEVAATRSACH